MRRRRGFTLVELMIVMVIIGILITFILKASSAAVRRAEEKATIALVAKLEQAMTDRVDALTTYQADPTPAHYSLAAIYPTGYPTVPRIESVQRAQVIAQFDYLRAQLPDVFVRQLSNANYPLNFAGTQFGPGSATTELDYQLPIGNSVVVGNGGSWNGNLASLTPGTGIYGASYEIAAGIYKQLGYGPKGTDGSDNDGDGLVDEMDEGLTPAEQTAVRAKLDNHTHKTARAEMLYAILVEGGGTYGSSFDKDDFTSREVQDTDGDGLMEFVDAWGEPLQYYRWPVLYRSDAQNGFPDTLKLTSDASVPQKPGPYSSAYEAREQNPLDPNQTLLAPAWWGLAYNKAAWLTPQTLGNVSKSAAVFMDHFGPCLVDPAVISQGTPAPSSLSYWDRSATASPTTTGSLFYRRAYYSRFLILSAGPDKTPGTAMLGVNYQGIDDRATIETPSSGTVAGPGGMSASQRDTSGAGAALSVQNLLIESQGGKVDPVRAKDKFGTLNKFDADGRNDTSSQLEYYSQDDISSQNLQGTGGVLQ